MALSSPELMESLKRLAPFVIRARMVSTGREKLFQHRNQLAFLFVAEDLSENSRHEILRDFPCPIYQGLTAEAFEELFHFHNTKMLGFSRGPLSTQIQQLLKGRRLVAPSVDSVNMPEHPKVAVLGASGIGKYHANWWKLSGAEVCAFLGSSEESIQRTEQSLATLLGYPVKGHVRLERLLQHAHPDIVDICLPPPLHFRTARTALLAGCHVLCEKPFLYDPALPPAVLHQQCNELIELANARRRLLGMCSQYIVIAQKCHELGDFGDHPITRLDCTLLTPIRNHVPGPLSSWLDLGSHLLAIVQTIGGTRHLRPETLQIEIGPPNQTTVHFTCTDRADTSNPPPALECHLTVGHLPAESQMPNQRIIRLNDLAFTANNAQDTEGNFALDLHRLSDAQTHKIPDPMRMLIADFCQGKARIPGRLATQNLDWLLKIAQGIQTTTSKHRV